MFKVRLNAIAAKALLDHDFQAAILNGRRMEKLGEFNLDPNQIEAVMAIEATDVDQFIRNLGKLMQRSSLAC
ncbi:MAG: hypothetical protein OEV06_01950 [Anaerolineae bacterium]|nr:hypothetical protein [Anaerolineae bacterium]